MILVKLRCRRHGCTRVLLRIGDDAPHDISGTVVIPACPRHGGLPFRRAIALRREGKPTAVTVGHRIDLAQLQPAIAEARRTGKTQVRPV